MTDSEERPRRVEFTPTPSWQAFMYPIKEAAQDNAAAADRAAPANSRPSVGSSGWPEDLIRLGGVRIRRAPIVASRADSHAWVQQYSGKEILVEKWYGPNASVALWLTPQGRYPTTGYPPSAWPVAQDVTESVESVNGSEMHLSSYRVTRRDEPTEYHVVAYWKLEEKMWAMVSAVSKSRNDQEMLLAMIRSAESPPPTTVAV